MNSSGRTQKLVVGVDILLPEAELMVELTMVGRAHSRHLVIHIFGYRDDDMIMT
jgi:hypothetical protein